MWEGKAELFLFTIRHPLSAIRYPLSAFSLNSPVSLHCQIEIQMPVVTLSFDR
jgi:hypothetical protein